MKRLFAYFLLLCLLLTTLPVSVLASESEETTEATEAVFFREPGMCGEDLSWSYNGGTLTISGTGAMDDYSDGDAPWLEHRNNIKAVVFTGGVTYIGEGAFTDYDNLESVDFGSAMHTIGKRAFKDCDGLTTIILPATFRKFDEECFMSCDDLTEIYCLGGMPSFRGNCVWDVYATIYYPANNAWPMEHVLQLQSAFHNRILFQAGSPEAAQTVAEVTEPTEKATEPAATEPEETVAETRAVVTVSMTEPAETTQPATEQTEAKETVPETTRLATEETVPETQPAERKHLGSMSGIVVCGVLFAGVVSLLLIGALVFRRRRY